MEINKEKIKEDLIEKSNDILKRYNEPYIVDHIAIMNTSKSINFLGNMRVIVEDSVKKIKKELEESFKDYGIIKIRDRKVVPCCAPPYVHISFNITINN